MDGKGWSVKMAVSPMARWWVEGRARRPDRQPERAAGAGRCRAQRRKTLLIHLTMLYQVRRGPRCLTIVRVVVGYQVPTNGLRLIFRGRMLEGWKPAAQFRAGSILTVMDPPVAAAAAGDGQAVTAADDSALLAATEPPPPPPPPSPPSLPLPKSEPLVPAEKDATKAGAQPRTAAQQDPIAEVAASDDPAADLAAAPAVAATQTGPDLTLVGDKSKLVRKGESRRLGRPPSAGTQEDAAVATADTAVAAGQVAAIQAAAVAEAAAAAATAAIEAEAAAAVAELLAMSQLVEEPVATEAEAEVDPVAELFAELFAEHDVDGTSCPSHAASAYA